MNLLERLLLAWFVGDGFAAQTEGMDSEAAMAIPEGMLSEVYTLEEVTPEVGISSVVSDLVIIASLSLEKVRMLDTDHLKSRYSLYTELSSLASFPISGDHAYALVRAPLYAALRLKYSYDPWQRAVASEVALTHTHPFAVEAARCISYALVLVLREEAANAGHLASLLLREIAKRSWDAKLETALRTAINQKPLAETPTEASYLLLPTITVVFHTLLSECSYEDGMDTIARRGGNSRLSCALYSALKVLLDGYGPPERWVDEIAPSASVQQLIKSETLFERETIRMERLASRVSETLLKEEEER
ncbi:MAG TPA: ADP-ribosylglycohydrolase family protein [Sphaerochaeta sp.]|nr:ADP-ribosylglycohydrolase family protein [Sphaerochaeta sp.]